MDWAEVAQKLGYTVDRVKRKWSKIKNTGAVSEPLFAQLPLSLTNRVFQAIISADIFKSLPLHLKERVLFQFHWLSFNSGSGQSFRTAHCRLGR